MSVGLLALGFKSTKSVSQQQIQVIQVTSGRRDLETLVDNGESIYSKAIVRDQSRIYICVGSGIFVDFPLDEARIVAQQWIDLLKKKKEIYLRKLAEARVDARGT